jgi:hypothetical protein
LFAFLLSELSDASKNTLLQQGGVMSDFEADKFEKSEQFDGDLNTNEKQKHLMIIESIKLCYHTLY